MFLFLCRSDMYCVAFVQLVRTGDLRRSAATTATAARAARAFPLAELARSDTNAPEDGYRPTSVAQFPTCTALIVVRSAPQHLRLCVNISRVASIRITSLLLCCRGGQALQTRAG